ncbi:MAG: translation elongation factor Ts [Candidatus Cloacimonadales bacterium]
MSISAKVVMELRKKTGAGMMDCKKALKETNGDMDAAITYLREKGISKAAKKADRVAAEGLIFAHVAVDNKKGAIIELNSETDFVAKNKDFVNFGEKIVKFVVDNNISELEALKTSTIDGKSFNDVLTSLIATIGENLNVRRIKLIESDGFVASYIHMGGKIGVLVSTKVEPNEARITKARDIAMHAAAMDPRFFDKSEVTQEILDKEKSIMKTQLLDEGKPEKIIEKILIGKMNKFYEENCLLQQKFVKDDKQTVEQYAGEMKIEDFVRFKVGDGIEKKSEDFAAEVAAQIKG